MNTKEELRKLFEENLELAKFANAQALIVEMAHINVSVANEWSKELKDAQDANEEDARADEQLKHKEEPEKEF